MSLRKEVVNGVWIVEVWIVEVWIVEGLGFRYSLVMVYPVAETFHSIQGEGHWTGTQMLFVRLAGCNVGKYSVPALEDGLPAAFILPTDFPLLEEKKHSICTSAVGQSFLCDTDYHTYQKLTIEEILKEHQGEGHVCVTGGEPFLHDLTPLIVAWQKIGVMVHIETSGTLPIQFLHSPQNQGLIRTDRLWITCSPKEGIREDSWFKADEFKILVAPGVNPQRLTDLSEHFRGQLVYLQPINGVNEAFEDSLAICLDLIKQYPWLKLSAQLHKYLHQR